MSGHRFIYFNGDISIKREKEEKFKTALLNLLDRWSYDNNNGLSMETFRMKGLRFVMKGDLVLEEAKVTRARSAIQSFFKRWSQNDKFYLVVNIKDEDKSEGTYIRTGMLRRAL